MNAAEILLRKVFGFGEQAGDVFADPGAYIHPDARTSLFGPSGGKEAMIGRDAFVDFARRCEEALSGRSDDHRDYRHRRRMRSGSCASVAQEQGVRGGAAL